MDDDAIKALNLINSNADLLPAGHAILNRNVARLLAAGLIDYAPRRRTAYRLTRAGRAVV